MNKKDVMTKSNDGMRGLVLMAIGGVLLFNNFGRISLPNNSVLLLLPAMGVLFIISAIAKREAGLMIPGGILSGIGLGIIAETNAFNWAIFTDRPEGAAFMLAFAAGWLSIVILSKLFTDETQWWALIPATVFVLISGTLTGGGIFETALSLLGQAWPLLLIVIGIKVMLQESKSQN